MYGIFINEDKHSWAIMIAVGRKTVETRSRNMLKNLVGERVALISTRRDRFPIIVGYATITRADHVGEEEFNSLEWFSKHFVCDDDEYASNGYGKWCYTMSNAEVCDPYALPADAIRHGRSYAEF